MPSFVMGDPRTVMQNGPAPFRNESDWSETHANDLAHFIQLVEALTKSNWFQRGVQLAQDTDGSTSSFSNPDSDATVAAITLIRQFLLPRDKAFETALDCYKQFCGDGMKIAFVDMEFQQFTQLLNRPLHFFYHQNEPELMKQNTEGMIDLIVYGSGLFHRKSNSTMEPLLSSLMQNCPREKMLFAFHGCCRSVMEHAFKSLPIIKQDFDHWVSSGNCTAPTRIGLQGLFDDIPQQELPEMQIGDERITWSLGSQKL